MDEIKDNASEIKKRDDKHPRIIVTPVYVGDKPMEEVFTDVISGTMSRDVSSANS